LVKRRPVPSDQIAALGISGTFSSTVAVDKNGDHLINSLTWIDPRGAPRIQERISEFAEMNGVNVFKAMKWVSKNRGSAFSFKQR